MKQTANAAAGKLDEVVSAEPVILLKRIGSTTYKVSVRFSETSKETMQDKILRMIESEVHKSA